ncbi:hypothetical protein [Fusobacterium polymorphum]|uniref:Uncharacterized protein n=3 Tax=Fusobacterium nucleatum subsp. polymorphum TaxID=76857 RepID=A0A2C5ZGW4_FUSNP|nr:hypothetical protein [Fusobacterium polymorphum]PHH98639.1 hypothetical protein CA836_02090 [Fusobacterium polymorphum]
MSKKDFNKGTKLGIKLSEDIVKSNTESIKKINETIQEIGNNTYNIKELINSVIKTQEENDIEKLFGIVKTLDSKDLEKEEKLILFQILNEIGKIYEPNENQKKFKLKLLKYLSITVNETLEKNQINNFKTILENIEKKEEKIIYKLICEYLYLDKYNSLEDYEDILSIFHYSHYFKKDIENEIKLKIQLFGTEILCEQFIESKKIENNKKVYYEKEKKENIEISEECASIFFGDNKKNEYYIETSSFIIYPFVNKIISLNKITLEKLEILSSLKIISTDILFKYKKIASYNDILYVIIENDLYYYNLNESEEKLILRITKKYNSNNVKYDIENLTVKKEKIIFKNRDLVYYNLENNENITINFISSNYFLKDNFIYFISKESKEEKTLFLSSDTDIFSLKKYTLGSKLSPTKLIDSFMKNTSYIYDSYKSIYFSSLFEDNICIISKDDAVFPLSLLKYEKYILNIKNNSIKDFKFSGRISQVEQYKNFLIYNNHSDGFKIQKHNILTDKVLTLIENYGRIKKEDVEIFTERLATPEFFDRPIKYKRIGKWIFDEINNKIIDIEK